MNAKLIDFILPLRVAHYIYILYDGFTPVSLIVCVYCGGVSKQDRECGMENDEGG